MVNFIRPVNLNMPSGIEVQDAKTGGDVADFNWYGLLTDWRGEPIIAPKATITENIHSYWKRVCATEYELRPAYNEVITPASVKTTTGIVNVVTAQEINAYKGSVVATYTSINTGATMTRPYSTPYAMITSSDVNNYLYLQAVQGVPNGYTYTSMGSIIYETVQVSAGTNVSYTYIASVEYTPAVIKLHDAEFVEIPHTHTDMPTFAGNSYGQVSGCWEWTMLKTIDATVTPGQFWAYYGTFGEVTANVSAATTNLTYNGNKLPANATLVQEGNTVRYDNVKSPVEYSYEIYVPVSVTYGWGTLNAKLTIKVNPVK